MYSQVTDNTSISETSIFNGTNISETSMQDGTNISATNIPDDTSIHEASIPISINISDVNISDYIKILDTSNPGLNTYKRNISNTRSILSTNTLNASIANTSWNILNSSTSGKNTPSPNLPYTSTLDTNISSISTFSIETIDTIMPNTSIWGEEDY